MKINSRIQTYLLAALCLVCRSVHAGAANHPATLVQVRRIWAQAPYNSFTDLIRFRRKWYCVFREGTGHVSSHGTIRVLCSTNTVTWQSVAHLTLANADLRDPKICVTPDRRLMLTTAAAHPKSSRVHHQTMAWFSRDGVSWNGPNPIGDPNFWLWRVTWHKGIAYSVGYDTGRRHRVRLYRSNDGLKFKKWVDPLFDKGFPNEATLLFLPDDTALCVLRRDGEPGSAQLGEAAPPYRQWHWRDLGIRLGGPDMIRLPKGQIVVAARTYRPAPHTTLLGLDPETAKLIPLLTLPSGGDTSYPGLVWHGGKLWVSYYSSHKGKAAIYLATVAFGP